MIHNPKHPGCLVKSFCLEPLGLSVTEAAKALKVSRPTLSKLLNGHINISPEMAVRISVVFSTSDKLWVDLQAGYDLWKAQQKKNKFHLRPLVLHKAA
ncbi:MAG TPA: HigA family addiction module antitoxin [Gammaproteobacteria bacterium]|nr:HigA family addiction module antitoxin [Gammaproteobacteria bacterium]